MVGVNAKVPAQQAYAERLATTCDGGPSSDFPSVKRSLRQFCARTGIAAALVTAPTPVMSEQIKPLFQHDLPNVAGKTLTIVEVSFAPGTKADAHRHGQAFVYAYVLSGTILSQLAGEAARTYRAGEGWFEVPGAHHLLTENPSRTAAARLLVAFVANPGAPPEDLRY
jgi:quercetin dioxygenase-like cupin family protein